MTPIRYEMIVIGAGPAGLSAAIEAAKHGITAVIQPGGSIRDEESITACNENGLPMVFTGIRHFKH